MFNWHSTDTETKNMFIYDILFSALQSEIYFLFDKFCNLFKPIKIVSLKV